MYKAFLGSRCESCLPYCARRRANAGVVIAGVIILYGCASWGDRQRAGSSGLDDPAAASTQPIADGRGPSTRHVELDFDIQLIANDAGGALRAGEEGVVVIGFSNGGAFDREVD